VARPVAISCGAVTQQSQDVGLTSEPVAVSRRGQVRRLLSSPGLMRTGLLTYVYSALTLVANLVSGVVSARALGPSGRGVVVALMSVTQLAGFLFAMGVAQSLSYFIARRPEDGPSLLTTWTLMLIPCAGLAVLAGELIVPAIFSAHNPETVTVGRWFLVTVVLVIGTELNYGLLLGAHEFLLYNVLRFAQPALYAGSLVVLWRVGALNVTSALIAPTAATLLTVAVGMADSIGRIGFGSPNLRLGLSTLWYGIRGQGTVVATHVNARLDVAMLPAYVGAFSVGLYSVATNISLIVYQLSNAFAALLVPVAARDSDRGPDKVLGSFYASMFVAGALAAVIAVFAAPLLGLVYGHRFREAAPTLRLILPGAVLFAGSSILSAGVYAAGRPFIASLGQVVGVVVTVAGLAVFLATGGITAAAIVSSSAYATVFAATLISYKLVTRRPWRWFLLTPARLRALAHR
jgi:O-antigen/teichoic acid export membrane protein